MSNRTNVVSHSNNSCSQGGSHTNTRVWRDYEEARKQEAVGSASRQARNNTEAVLLMVEKAIPQFLMLRIFCTREAACNPIWIGASGHV